MRDALHREVKEELNPGRGYHYCHTIIDDGDGATQLELILPNPAEP